MTVYVVIRLAREKSGEIQFAGAEKAFADPTKAEAYVKSVGVVWEEIIQGYDCQCERAIHVLEVVE